MSDRPKLGEAVRALVDAYYTWCRVYPHMDHRVAAEAEAALAPLKVPEFGPPIDSPHYAAGCRHGYRAALRDIGVEVEE